MPDACKTTRSGSSDSALGKWCAMQRLVQPNTPKLTSRKCNVFYGAKQALFDVEIYILPNHVTAFIGPSGCGKSTFLLCFNRINYTIDICRVSGDLRLDGEDI